MMVWWSTRSPGRCPRARAYAKESPNLNEKKSKNSSSPLSLGWRRSHAAVSRPKGVNGEREGVPGGGVRRDVAVQTDRLLTGLTPLLSAHSAPTTNYTHALARATADGIQIVLTVRRTEGAVHPDVTLGKVFATTTTTTTTTTKTVTSLQARVRSLCCLVNTAVGF